MAQVKVTDFFATRKRKPDEHPSKRQKLRETGVLSIRLSKDEPKSAHALPNSKIKCAEPQISSISPDVATSTSTRKTRSNASGASKSKQSTRSKSSKTTKARKNPNQTLITEVFPQTSQSQHVDVNVTNSSLPSSQIELPNKATFDFRLTTISPSDCDSIVTCYGDLSSPHSTPTKRAGRKVSDKSVALKRKRKSVTTDCAITPEVDVEIPTLPKSKPVGAKKKLEMLKQITLEPPTESPSTLVTENTAMAQLNKKPTAAIVSSKDTEVQAPSVALKSMIAKCGKLSDLKACLQKVQDLSKDLKQKKPPLPSVSADNTTGPAAIAGPVESLRTAKPAYERFKDLAAKIPPTLTLPYKYKVLDDMFRGADTVISIMYNRLERCTFGKLKRAVQDMIRKNFELNHLGQIKTVYPESYEVRQEKGIVESGVRSNKYQMTIEPIINTNENNKKVTLRKDGHPVLSTNEIIRRKETFRSRLFDIVKLHHQKFLESLKPPMKVDSAKITRWHPKFLVDDVPEVAVAELPSAPEAQRELITARDVLNQARGNVPTRVENVLKKVAQASEKVENLKNLQKTAEINKSNVNKTTPTSKGVIPPANTSGISVSLLERIRAKESLKTQAAMMRDESTESEMDMLGRLPEMIKILRSYFVTEKKATLTEDCIIMKLCDSYKSSISHSSAEKHLDYLLKVLPDWISSVTVSSGKYIKINRQAELSQLNKKLAAILKQKEYTIPVGV